MTPQEQGMINGLIDRVQRTQLAEKDADAERLLQGSLGRNPDSLYILAQTVLVQQYALDQAQAQLSSLKSQVEQMQAQQQHPKPATSFLGGLLGGGSSEHSAPPPPPAQTGGQYAPVPGYSAQGSYAQQSYAAQPSYGSPQYGAPAQGGGFLRSALQTATGVAAGALAFEGVESLMHGFGNAATGIGGGSGGRPEEIVNNYYGDDSHGGSDRGGQFADDDRSRDNNDPGSNAFTDSNDRDSFAASDDNPSDDNTSDSDNSMDSDTSGFDDGGDSMSDDSSSDNSF